MTRQRNFPISSLDNGLVETRLFPSLRLLIIDASKYDNCTLHSILFAV